MTAFTESVVEEAALAWLESLGWPVTHGPEIAPGEPAAERADYGQVVLEAAAARCAGAAQPGAAARGAGRRLPQAHAARRRRRWSARNRAVHRLLVDGVTVEYRARRRRDPRGAGAGDRLRRPGEQRLAGGQPVHRRREQAHAPAGRRAVRQRPAAGGDRAQERGRRERHDLDGLPAAPDLQGGDPVAVRLQRAAGRLRRRGGAGRHAHRRARVVQALAHHRGRGAGRSAPARAAGGDRGRLRRSGASSTWCATSSSSRTTGGGTLVKKMAGYHQFHAVQVAVEETLRAARAARAADRAAEPAGGTRRAAARRQARRPARRRGLAHAGLGQEPDHGLLRRARSSASRRWRTRRSSCSPTATTSTTSSSAPSRAARTCCASRRCRPRAARDLREKLLRWRRAAWCSPRSRSSSPRRRATATRCSPTGATSW